jgi:hypothetical protein
MISFDFRTPVTVPHFSANSSGIYFLNRKLARCFGTVVESRSKQDGYLLFYDQVAGQNWQHIQCMLDYIIEQEFNKREMEREEDTTIPKYETILLRCDNCSKENKNKYMVSYMADLVRHYKLKKVSLHTLVVGHTKFAPDSKFGQLSSALKTRDIFCGADLVDVCDGISNVTGVYLDASVFYNRKEWIETYFAGKIEGISQYHHIEIRSENCVQVTKRRVPCDLPHSIECRNNENTYTLTPRQHLDRIYAYAKQYCNDVHYQVERKLVFPKPGVTFFKEFDDGMKIQLKHERDVVDDETFSLWEKVTDFIPNEEQKSKYQNYIQQFKPNSQPPTYICASTLNEEVTISDSTGFTLPVLGKYALIPRNIPKNQKFKIHNLCLKKNQ